MTDEELFLQLMERFGLVVTKEAVTAPGWVTDLGLSSGLKPAVSYTLAEGAGPRQAGYTGFQTDWLFTADGAFVAQGTWE